MINRATSGSQPTLYVSKQCMGFKIPDKSTVDHSFHGFTYATCQRNMTIIGRIRVILSRLRNRNYDTFPQIRMRVTRNPDFIKTYLKGVKENPQVDASIADNIFHLVLLKCEVLYLENLATILKRRVSCVLQHF